MPHTDPVKERARVKLKNARYHALWKRDKRCMTCGRKRANGVVLCARHQAAYVKYRADCRARLKAAVYGYYGTVCKYCGALENLSLHHINNDGKEQRGKERAGAGADFYRSIVKEWPKDVEIVCMKCHVRIPHRRWKINPIEAEMIRQSYRSGSFSRRELAIQHGVHYQTIWAITTTNSPRVRKT